MLSMSSDELAGKKCKFQWERVRLNEVTLQVETVTIAGATKPG